MLNISLNTMLSVFNLHQWLMRWYGLVLPLPGNAQKSTPSAVSPLSPAKSWLTPRAWFVQLKHPVTVVAYIDQPSTQLLEMVALSPQALADFLSAPMYCDPDLKWQVLPGNRLRRLGFEPATLFAEQEDALTAMEDLFCARWHASSELAQLDFHILAAFETTFPRPEGNTAPGAPVVFVPALDHLIALQSLLAQRLKATQELTRLDELALPLLQRLGVALPQGASAPIPQPPPPQ